jgi:hypothetical protein
MTEEGSRFTRSAPAGRADPQRLVLATAFQVSRPEINEPMTFEM